MATTDPKNKATDDADAVDPTDAVDIEARVDGEEDDDSLFDKVPEAVQKRLEAFVPELVKKTFAAGMGAVFSTEDGIRRITKEMKMPKEVAGYLLDTAGNTKDEFLRILAREVREFLQTINLSEEIAKMLTLLSFEVKTEIRFIPNDEKYSGVEPDVKASVRLKRADSESDAEPDEDEEAKRPKRRLRRRTQN